MFNLPDHFDFIPYNNLSAEENMALDETLFTSVKEGKRHAVFRVYGWDKPSITIGYFQKSETLNMERCSEYQVPVIRRMTGGRAVYHHHEITYSLFLKGEEHFLMQKKKLFSKLSEIILEGLAGIGLEGSISIKTLGEAKNPNCFKTTSVCEIVSPRGDKLVGSALLVQRDSIMRQGSIPLSDSYKRLTFFIKSASENKSDQLIDSNINSKKDHKLIERFISGIKRKINLKESKLSSDEIKMMNDLVKDKYHQDFWNLRR